MSNKISLKEIVDAVESVANEKGIDKEVIFGALEAALASAARKRIGEEEIDVRVAINRKSGEFDAYRRWKVFADDSRDLEFPSRELRMEDALDVNPAAVIGDFVEEVLPPGTFGRIDAMTAKQVIVQKVREAERAQVVDAFQERIGTMVSGIVKRVDRNGVFVDLGGNA
jgi:N utilization substance protein A